MGSPEHPTREVAADRTRDHRQQEEQKVHRPSRAGGLRRWRRWLLWASALTLAGLVLLKSAHYIVATFHWAEKRVDRDSWWHMWIAFAVTLPFNLGVPIPFVHQAWAVAIGVFFRWNAFAILVAALCVGVPMPFMIGRRLAGGAQIMNYRNSTPTRSC